MRWLSLLAVAALMTACNPDGVIVVPVAPDAPTNLDYVLDPSGVADQPTGLLLSWTPSNDPDVEFYRIYSRPPGDDFGLRGETTSPTFHDAGLPHLEYYVTAVAGDAESERSNIVNIDERLRIEAPTSITSFSLNGAVLLSWSDNAFLNNQADFQEYRVYSTDFSLDSGLCGADWVLEGTTVAPEFLVSALLNGIARCYAATALTINGDESLFSPIRDDTPRFDARNILVWARDVLPGESGFLFWDDLNGDSFGDDTEVGFVLDGNDTASDFFVSRDVGTGQMFLNPLRTGTTVRRYQDTPIEDLTSIDIAPVSGYARTPLEALPGFGYVFQMDRGDGFFRYGGLRVTHVGREFLLFDWSFQDDPGNPELSPGRHAF